MEFMWHRSYKFRWASSLSDEGLHKYVLIPTRSLLRSGPITKRTRSSSLLLDRLLSNSVSEGPIESVPSFQKIGKKKIVTTILIFFGRLLLESISEGLCNQKTWTCGQNPKWPPIWSLSLIDRILLTKVFTILYITHYKMSYLCMFCTWMKNVNGLWQNIVILWITVVEMGWTWTTSQIAERGMTSNNLLVNTNKLLLAITLLSPIWLLIITTLSCFRKVFLCWLKLCYNLIIH